MASEIRVTNIKANDGTASLTVADSTGNVSAPNLIINDGGTIGSASDTDAITISSTGKVTTADSELNVKTTSHTFTVKGIDEVIYEDDGTTVVDADSGQFAVYNGSTKLIGITEHGYVLKPNQPLIYLTGNASNVSTVGNITQFTAEIAQGGMTWNSSNGRVTVSVSGKYAIHFLGYHYSATTRTEIKVNGLVKSRGHSAGASADQTRAHFFVGQLSAGDYIEFRLHSGSVYAGATHTSAYVQLIS